MRETKSSPARGGGAGQRPVTEGALLLTQHVWRAPTTTPLRVAVPLPVPGRIA